MIRKGYKILKKMQKKKSSKELCMESLSELLMKNSIERISVDDIIDNCGLSRSTFYRLFKDKYDLMNYIFQAEIDRFFSINSDNVTWNDLQENVSQFLYKNSQLFKSIIEFRGQDSLEQYLYHQGIEYWVNQIESITGERMSHEDSYALKIYTYGAMHTYFEWLDNDCPIEPSELTKIMSECIPHSLKKYNI